MSSWVILAWRARLHGGHARRELRGDRLLQGAEDLAVEVEREDGVEQLRRLLLENHVGREFLGLSLGDLLLRDGEVAVLGRHFEDLVAGGLDALRRERHDGAHRRDGRDHRDERGVDELNAVELAGVVGGEELGGDLGGHGRRRRTAALHRLADRCGAPLEIGAALAAHENQLRLDALRRQLSDARLGLLDGGRVVRAAQPAVARDDEQTHRLGLALLEERDIERLRGEPLQQATQDALERLREGSRAQAGLLRAANLGGGDEAHGGRDLLRVLHRADTGAQLADVVTHDGGS
eukprot:scaffold20367_cov100-Isochrysis_galbana.AAC.4